MGISKDRDDFRDENRGNDSRLYNTAGNQNANSQPPEQEDENGAGGNLDPAESQNPNNGDWDKMRDQTRTDESGNLGDSDDDPGGAGSTGSEATNDTMGIP